MDEEEVVFFAVFTASYQRKDHVSLGQFELGWEVVYGEGVPVFEKQGLGVWVAGEEVGGRGGARGEAEGGEAVVLAHVV